MRAAGHHPGAPASFDREALTVAMAVVPGLCSRNKHFALYGDPDVRRARARASLLRGVVRQLSGAHGNVEHVVFARGERGVELRFAIRAMHLERRVALSDLEASCVVFLASRAGVSHLHATEDDRAKIHRALERMAPFDVDPASLSRVD